MGVGVVEGVRDGTRELVFMSDERETYGRARNLAVPPLATEKEISNHVN